MERMILPFAAHPFQNHILTGTSFFNQVKERSPGRSSLRDPSGAEDSTHDRPPLSPQLPSTAVSPPPHRHYSVLPRESTNQSLKEKKNTKYKNLKQRRRGAKRTCFREETTTAAPSRPSRWAMAKPIPWVEAVTIATLPSNLCISPLPPSEREKTKVEIYSREKHFFHLRQEVTNYSLVSNIYKIILFGA